MSQADETSLPLVTVVTPAYNCASLIVETIDSVLGQEYPNLEYIVLDDGSTDGTAEVIRRYEGRLRWTSHDNLGEACTVNRGLELSHGEIIGVVNADDPLRPGAIREIVAALLDDPDAVVAFPDWELIDENGDVLRRVDVGDFSHFDMVRLHHCAPGPGSFFRRSLYKQIGGRDPTFRMVGDFDFWLRAGLVGPLRHIPKTLATWRHHPGGASSVFSSVGMALEEIAVMSKLFGRSDLPEELRAVEREAFTNAFHTAGIIAGRALAGTSRRFMVADALADAQFAATPDELLESLTLSFRQAHESLRTLHEEVARRDDTVVWLHGEVAQRDQTITWLHAEVAERDKTIDWLHAEVAMRDSTIAGVAGRVTQSSSTADKAEGQAP